MALFVNTNVAALNGQKNLTNVTNRMNSSFEKLSSGSRINSAKDDAAGLQIADRLTTQIIGLQQSTRNANDGISIAQIAEGALSEVTTNVQRMRQLAVQGGNRTLSRDDRNALGQEFTKLLSVNNDIANRTAFGTMNILNYGSSQAGFQIQSGAQSGEQDTVTTGNAMLTALFGGIANKEVGNGDAVAGILLSTMVAEPLSNLGTLGEVVAAYMFATNISSRNEAFNALFGLQFGALSTTVEGTFSQLAEESGIQIDVDEFTKVLTQTANFEAGTFQSRVASNIGTSDFTGIAVGSVDSTGYSDTQLHVVYAFMTDHLLDAMTGLVTEVDRQRAKMGAEQNGLASTIRSNTASIVNVSDARARIQDTDFAMETAELTRNQIIQQASTSILSQANQLPQAALSLLGG